MASFTTVDGNRFQYLTSESNKHLHIVVRRANMLYDKGRLFVYGFMNGPAYCGLITYHSNGSIALHTIYGSGIAFAYGGLEDNGSTIRIVLEVQKWSTYVAQSTDPFEVAHTTG